MKEKIKSFFLLIFRTIKKFASITGYVRAILCLVGGVALFYLPAILLIVFKNYAAAATYVAVWAGPFTPALFTIALLSIGLMLITSPKSKRKALKEEFILTWKAILKELDDNIEKIRAWIKKRRE